MLTKDLVSKKLLKRLLVDFGNQLFDLNIAQAELLNSEQARIEGKRADLVARVQDAEGASYILHVEIQNDNRGNVPIRMLRYYTDLAFEHVREDIKQCLLYIGKSPLTIPDHIQKPNLSYSYQVLDMHKQDGGDFLNSENPDALVLAILCNHKGLSSEDLVDQIVRELKRLHGAKLDSLRDSLMMLDVLASNRDLQNLVKESSEMLVEIEELGSYQLGLEQGVEQGLEQGSDRRQREIVLNLLSKLSPEQAAELSGVALSEVEAIAAARNSSE